MCTFSLSDSLRGCVRERTNTRYIHLGHKEGPVVSCHGTPMSHKKPGRVYSKVNNKKLKVTVTKCSLLLISKFQIVFILFGGGSTISVRVFRFCPIKRTFTYGSSSPDDSPLGRLLH